MMNAVCMQNNLYPECCEMLCSAQYLLPCNRWYERGRGVWVPAAN